jgi:hypothetical protein
MKWTWNQAGVVFGVVLSTSSVARAQTAYTFADARDYEVINYAPNNTVTFYGYGREVSTSDKANVTQTVGVFRANYLLKFGNLAIVPLDLALPVVNATVFVDNPMGATTVLQASGVGDVTYLPTIAYLIPEDAETQTHTHIGLTAYVTAPTGSYDEAHPVNIGDNRWRIQPNLTVGQRFLKNWTLELNSGVALYTNNSKAFTGMAPLPLKQDPTIGVEAHLAWNPTPDFFLAVSYFYNSIGALNFAPAGAAEVLREKSQTLQTLRFTYAIHVEKSTLLLLQYNQDIAESGGVSISRFIGARISHSLFL